MAFTNSDCRNSVKVCTRDALKSGSSKLGDMVQEDDAIAEVENDKAMVELPSPVTGKVRKSRWKREHRGCRRCVSDV